MAVETGQAIIACLAARLKADATLRTLLGTTISVYRIMATEDPVFPYFRHKLTINGNLLHGIHTYYLDLWYDGANPTVSDAAIDRIKILFHEFGTMTGSDEANILLEWFSGGYIETDAATVWHYATQWNLWVGAARDITNIVG